MQLLALTTGPTVPHMNSVAEAIAGYWTAIGLDVEIAPTECAPLRAKSREATFYDPWIVGGGFRLNPEERVQ